MHDRAKAREDSVIALKGQSPPPLVFREVGGVLH